MSRLSILSLITVIGICSIAGRGIASDRVVVGPEDRIEFVVPNNSPVKFLGFAQYDIAQFEGRFVVSGTYHYGYVTKDPTRDATYDEIQLIFEPDAQFAPRLPYWKKDSHVSDLIFDNEAAFIGAVMPRDGIRKLKARKLFSMSGRATIVVKDYRAWVECDYAYYRVHFVSVVRPKAVRFSQSVIDEKSC